MRHEQAALVLHHLASQMQRRTDAGAAVTVFARVAFNRAHELIDGLDTALGRRHQHHGLSGNHADGREALDVVFDTARNHPADGDFVARAGQQGVAVWRRTDDFLRPNRTTSSAHVVDDHRHTQAARHLGAQGAPHQISAAAGRVSHHQRDGLVRILVGGLRHSWPNGQGGYRPKQQRGEGSARKKESGHPSS